MNSPIINTLIHMGVTNMTQRVSKTQCLIAGRLSLFTPNWRVITQDPWVLNCIQGYTIDLVDEPHQTHPPAELRFSQSETESLTAEAHKNDSQTSGITGTTRAIQQGIPIPTILSP